MTRTNVDIAAIILPVVISRPRDYLVSRAFLRLVLDGGHADWTEGGGRSMVIAALPFLHPSVRSLAGHAAKEDAPGLAPLLTLALALPEDLPAPAVAKPKSR